ncbi:unnamed protein product [Urochloa humidicola]
MGSAPPPPTMTRLAFVLLLFFHLAVPWPGTAAQGGYRVVSVARARGTLSARLELAGDCQKPELGPDVPRLSLTASLETDSRLHVRITDADHPRWEVPQDVIPRKSPRNIVHDTTAGASPRSRVLSAATSDLTFTIHGGEFLTYKVIGGILDFYFFAGPAPLDVVDQGAGLSDLPSASHAVTGAHVSAVHCRSTV